MPYKNTWKVFLSRNLGKLNLKNVDLGEVTVSEKYTCCLLLF